MPVNYITKNSYNVYFKYVLGPPLPPHQQQQKKQELGK